MSLSVFSTEIYRAKLGGPAQGALIGDIAGAIRQLAKDDAAGRRWCAENGYGGYTSYASLDDLSWRDSTFAELQARLQKHVGAFARALAFEMQGRKLTCDSMWVNLLKPGAAHTAHIHPGSVISGTIYIDLPPGASAIRFEDPRLGLMMAAPQVKRTAPPARQRFVSVAPKPGEVVLWESWLRHEVPRNGAKAERLSVSFNYS